MDVRIINEYNLIELPHTKVAKISHILADAGFDASVTNDNDRIYKNAPSNTILHYEYMGNETAEDIEDMQDDAIQYGHEYVYVNADMYDVYKLACYIYNNSEMDEIDEIVDMLYINATELNAD